MNKIIAGALAGLASTVPMSAVMLGLHRRLPWWERYALPPRQITEEITERVGVHHHLNEEAHDAAAIASHFAYGAAAGALYAPIAEKIKAPPVVKGIAFALGVWTLSYLGWLPSARILPIATEHPPRRNLLMIAAHIVWGAALGTLTGKWSETSEVTSDE